VVLSEQLSSLKSRALTCTGTVFEDAACDLPQMNYFAGFDRYKVERAIWSTDKAIEARFGGGHVVDCSALLEDTS
jgi:hypothetical protein